MREEGMAQGLVWIQDALSGGVGVVPHLCELSHLLHPSVQKGITQGTLQKAGEELTKVCEMVTVICDIFLGKY